MELDSKHLARVKVSGFAKAVLHAQPARAARRSGVNTRRTPAAVGVPREQILGPNVCLSGFKAIIDFAFDADGNVYVLQHATGPTMLLGPGELIRVAPVGTRTTVIAGLDRPTSVAIGPDAALYVTNQALSVGAARSSGFSPDP